MKPEQVKKIINKKLYDTEKAVLIASDVWWDGFNHERDGRNTFLYKSITGNYFKVTQSQWVGEKTNLIPLTLGEAYELYEQLEPVEDVPFEYAFPDIVIEEA